MKFKLAFSDRFNKKYKKLIKSNYSLKDKVIEKLEILRSNPKDISLKSHKVNSRYFDNVFSSSVTGDIRIIWKYDNEGNIEIIYLLDIGGHDGGNGVY
jgi:mRNA-degrading endonuclease YafQ of YafQ-DinJ toxin-antitoxin module